MPRVAKSTGNKTQKRRKVRRKKIHNTKEIDSEDERVKKRLSAKFKAKTQQRNGDDLPCLKISKKEQVLVKNGEKHNVLLKRSQEASLNRLNQVECSTVKIATSWKCALCQERTLRSILGDLFGPYIIQLEENHWPTHLAKKPLKLNKQGAIYCDLWLHGPCALSAPNVFLVGSQLVGLQSHINTFWAQHCAVCSKEGAAIEEGDKYYHYLCALQKGLKPF